MRPPDPVVYGVVSATAVAVVLLVAVLTAYLGVFEPDLRVVAGVLPLPVDSVSAGFAAAAVTAGSVPAAVYATRSWRWQQALRSQVLEFLAAYSVAVKASETVVEAVDTVAHLLQNPMRSLLEMFRDSYRVTGSLEEAYSLVFKRVPRDVAYVLRTVLVYVPRAGGRVEESVAKIASYFSQTVKWREDVDARLSEFVPLVYIAVVTYAIIGAVVVGLLTSMIESAEAVAAAVPEAPRFFTVAVDPLEVLAVMYYSGLVLAAASSAMIGKALKGYVLLMFRYLVVLVPIVYVGIYLLQPTKLLTPQF